MSRPGGEERRLSERRVAQRRSESRDADLAVEIREILASDPELDAREIEVQVEDGTVTLRGIVDGSEAGLLAEELVESVAGVREVRNALRVGREE